MRKEVAHKIFAKGNGGTVFSAKITPKNLVNWNAEAQGGVSGRKREWVETLGRFLWGFLGKGLSTKSPKTSLSPMSPSSRSVSSVDARMSSDGVVLVLDFLCSEISSSTKLWLPGLIPAR